MPSLFVEQRSPYKRTTSSLTIISSATYFELYRTGQRLEDLTLLQCLGHCQGRTLTCIAAT